MLQPPAPLPFPEVMGGTESSNPLIMWSALLATGRHSQELYKSCLINITKEIFITQYLGNFKGLGPVSEVGTVGKDQINMRNTFWSSE